MSEAIEQARDTTVAEPIPQWESLLEQIFDGNCLVFPEFVHCLFQYLAINNDDDTQEAARSVAVRGMYVVQRAQSICKKKEAEEQEKNQMPPLWRDAIAFFCGAVFLIYPLIAASGIAYLVYTSHEYNNLKESQKNVVLCIGMLIVSWQHGHLNRIF